MVNLVTGNLFDSEAQTLVNAVNCAGVMGKGIARAVPALGCGAGQVAWDVVEPVLQVALQYRSV